jgi:thiopurine S-methyltransferase
MEPSDWVARWAENRIGFHKPTVQPWLVEHLHQLAPNGNECVLVPLCGKSVDMEWLERHGHSVIGVDVAEQGLRAFLTEQRRPFAEHDSPPFHVFASGRIELWHGDFFELDPAKHGTFPAIFDRAALIAIERGKRPAYARRLIDLLAPRGKLLLIGLEYDEKKMEGPPFTVARAEIEKLFGSACWIETLGAKSVIDEEPRFRERGLDALTEYALLLTKRL